MRLLQLVKVAPSIGAFVAAFCAASAFGQSYDAVELPSSFTIEGFGSDGTVYGINTATHTASTWSSGTVTAVPGASTNSLARGYYNGEYYGNSTNGTSSEATRWLGGSNIWLQGSSGNADFETSTTSQIQLFRNGVGFGTYTTTGGTHFYSVKNDTVTTATSAAFTSAYGMNDNGIVVGIIQTTVGSVITKTAYSYNINTDTFTNLSGVVGGTSSIAESINDSGVIAGYTNTAGIQTAFIDNNGSVTQIAALGGAGKASFASAINDSGEVVGDSYNSAGVDHAYVDINGTVTDLNSLVTLGNGNYLEDAYYLNDAGQILAKDSAGNYFELTAFAVPEPSTWAVILGSVSLLGVIAGKRRASRAVAIS